MLKTEDLVLPSAPPLIGLVSIDSGEEFDETKLREGKYKIETIDGCHSLNAQRQCLNSGSDNAAFQKRDVVLYRDLSDKECVKVGVAKNNATATSLKMTDWDYMHLLRRHLMKMCSLPENSEPPTEIPKEFNDFMNSLLNLTTVRECVYKST